jgi:hypothetical protein
MSKTDKPLNKIISETKGSKKYKVFVKDKSTGNIKTVRFGDSSMRNNRDKKSNRESFMARHKAILSKVKGQKNLSPAYWAVKSWQLGTKIS